MIGFLQVYSALQNLAKSFRHPQDAGLQMYYTVAWDYRRDMWEQAERVFKALRRVHSTTRCKAILVGHSFGARLAYTLLAVSIITSACIPACKITERTSACGAISSQNNPYVYTLAAQILFTTMHNLDMRVDV